MKVHADILKMCKTQEKRERIKWFHARRVFFEAFSLAHGLALARQCEHEDALFLASLFSVWAPATKEQAAVVFRSHSDDVRCLCWAALCGVASSELLRRSAQGGYAWGQAIYGGRGVDSSEHFMWLEKAVAQDEPEAMWLIARRLCSVGEDMCDQPNAARLLREAAELGHPWAQYVFAEKCFPRDSVERFAWLRRAATQSGYIGLPELRSSVVEQLLWYDEGASGRVVFEIGSAFAGLQTMRKIVVTAPAAERAVQLYEQWCGEAKQAVLCWLWLSRTKGVVHDIRLLIADRVWEEKAAWSERTVLALAKSRHRCLVL